MPRFRRRDLLMLVPLTTTPPSPSPRPPLAAVARPTTHTVHITFTFTFARLVGTVDDRVPDVASLAQQSLAFSNRQLSQGSCRGAMHDGWGAQRVHSSWQLHWCLPDRTPLATRSRLNVRSAPLLPPVRGACLFHGSRYNAAHTLRLAVGVVAGVPPRVLPAVFMSARPGRVA